MCGKDREFSYEAPFVDDKCWNCRFWGQYIRQRHDSNVARYRGRHFTILGELETSSQSYPPGTRWLFEFMDGRVVLATNVEVQGAIPPRFLQALPNNVKSLRTNWPHVGALQCIYQADLPESLGWGNTPDEEDPVVYREIVINKPRQGTLW